MKTSRRQFLATSAAVTTGIAFPFHKAVAATPELHARPGTAQIAPAKYAPTKIWGYEGQVPGPTLRVKQGERLVRRFVNELPQASTIHWHGIRIVNAMDGVPGMTQEAVETGDSFLYDFVAPDAGTYWYHPHNRTWEQLARGLYGALIVEEAEPPVVDRDEALLIDDWRLTDDASIAENFGAMHDWSHAGRLGNWLTVNGDGDYRLAVKQHERLRLRLINTANARVLSIQLRQMAGWVIALDGQPLEAPEPAGTISLAPAQRADLIVDILAPDGGEAFLASAEGDSGYAMATFTVTGSAREQILSSPEPLAPNPLPPTGDLATARVTDLKMEGGAMGRMSSAMMGGKMKGIRDLVGQGKAWAFNGMADMPAEPLLSARRGETRRIRMVNETAWPHAMHLHGHHFRQVLANGTTGPLRDTLLVNRGETAEIAFVADNPGDWLLHCHMVEHSAAGMMTWFRVA
ncbi:MAG: multicopper oxidase family protein [Rhodospirillales bacterium]